MTDATVRHRLSHALTPDRVRSALAVAAIHVGIGYALLAGLNVDFVRAAAETLRVFDLPPTPPPPPVEQPVPAPAPSKSPEGAAAPPNLRAEATPVVAPPPKLPVVTPTPVVAAVLPAEGSAPESGAADVSGPGTGAGGEGAGRGQRRRRRRDRATAASSPVPATWKAG
jgi:protein TonB